MTSQQFYRLIDSALAVDCRRLGFSRKRGSTTLWFAPLQSGALFYEVFKGPRNPYILPCGGRFNVHCNLTPSSDSKARDIQNEISYMEYFSDGDLDTMREIRDRIVQKVVNQKPTAAFDRLLLEMHAPLLRMNLGQCFRRHQLFPLPYLDADDVSAWGTFLAGRLEQTLIGARERPVFFMRVASS